MSDTPTMATVATEYNDDELEPPQWLDADFFGNVLRSQHSDAKLLGHSIQPASLKGDHYASLMFRVAIVYHLPGPARHTLTVIAKTVPDSATAKGRNLSDSHLFANELHCYAEIVPRFEAIWRRYTGEALQFAGRLLYSQVEPVPVIVLEDLCRSGYDILRERLFNLNEVHACLTKLAKWHAISHKVTMQRHRKQQQQQPSPQMHADEHVRPLLETTSQHVQQMQYGLFKAKNLLHSDYMRNGLRAVIDAIVSGGDVELLPYVAKLEALLPQLIAACETMNDAFGRGLQGPIYVLNHGDFHTKNIMIRRRRDGGANDAIEDMLFVDFQMTFLGPSVYDLNYASFTMLSKSLRDQNREELQQFYFERFVESLQKLHFAGDLPSYTTFVEDRKRWRCFEIFLAATFLPLTKLTEADQPVVDINLIFTSDEYRRQFYINPAYMAYLRELLPKYDAEGYLD